MVKRKQGDVGSLPEKKAGPVRFLNYISFPALDAPLVAGLWWLLLTTAFGGEIHWATWSALVSGVWAIYLCDRIFDSADVSDHAPPRKRFAAERRRIFVGLLPFPVLTAVVSAVFLPIEIWKQAPVVGGVTILYFIAYRWRTGAKYIPLKELLIGLCFAAGVGIPFAYPPDPVRLSALVLFGVLCVVNCLLISRAELDFDRKFDASAWFAEAGRYFPFRPILALTGVGVVVLQNLSLPVSIGVSLLLTTVCLWLISLLDAEKSALDIQPLCDAAVWLPAVVGLLAESLPWIF